jgi:TonB family protein
MDKSYTNSKLARKVYYIPSPQINYGLAFTKNPGLPLLDSREEYFDLGKYDEVPRRLPAIGAWTDNGESYRDGRPLFIVRLAAPYFKSEKMSAMNPVEKQPHVVTRNLFYVEIVGIWMIDGYTGKVISKTGAMPDVKWSAAPKSPETKPSAPRSITEVQITSMPKPVKPEGCAFEVKGTVSLRVTFQADGKIGSIAVVSGLPCGFSEAAIKAAREIKFTPQMNDGVPVAITKTIQYSF